MGAMSPLHWLLVIGVAVILFGGAGRLSRRMGDAAKGVRAFREGLKGDDPAETPEATPAATPPAAAPLPQPAAENETVR